MSEKQIINRVKKLRELENQKDSLEKQIGKIKAEIQADMQDTEELRAGSYLVRWTSTTSYRLDTAAFKKAYTELYERFKKPSATRRFSVTEV